MEAEVSDLRRRLGYPATTMGATATTNTFQSDINKANEIIRKLQDEVKSLRHRARAAESSLKQIERIGKETSSSYEVLRKEVGELRGQLSETQAERDRLSVELGEQKKLVEANEKVIEWLHQQINEDSLSRMLGRHGSMSGGGGGGGNGNGGKFDFHQILFPQSPRLSPDAWLGKAKVPERPPSSSSSTVPENLS